MSGPDPDTGLCVECGSEPDAVTGTPLADLFAMPIERLVISHWSGTGFVDAPFCGLKLRDEEAVHFAGQPGDSWRDVLQGAMDLVAMRRARG